MARMFTQAVLIIVTTVMNFPSQAMPEGIISDQVGKQKAQAECPYPCLPPPISVQNCPPPPSPPSQPSTPTLSPPSGGYYPPPAGYYYPPPPPSHASVYYPPPTGYFPYNSPPSYVNRFSPPPPDPILPYFPFYFKGPSAPPNASSASSLEGSLGLILYLILLGSFAFFNW